LGFGRSRRARVRHGLLHRPPAVLAPDGLQPEAARVTEDLEDEEELFAGGWLAIARYPGKLSGNLGGPGVLDAGARRRGNRRARARDRRSRGAPLRARASSVHVALHVAPGERALIATLLGALRLALGAIARNKMRAALTVLGIFIGITAVVIVTAAATSATDSISNAIDSVAANALYVSASPRRPRGSVRRARGGSRRPT